MDVNVEKTKALKADPIYAAYKKWADDNGVICPNLDYPVAFWDEGVIGTAAKNDIPPNKAYVFVPYSICINLQRAKSSEISHIFKKRFFTKHSRGNDHILWIFVLYEKLKGPESFWYPYFTTMSGFSNMIDWTEEELAELQDKLLVHDNMKWRDRISRIWKGIYGIIKNYPEYFPPDRNLYEEFMWSWKVCCTRGYAWEGGMLIPVADNTNHGEVYTSYESEEKSVLKVQAENRTSEVDYTDFLDIKLEYEIEVDYRKNTNRLEKYLEKSEIPEIRNIWQLDRVLENYRSSSSEDDERNIAECTSEEESAYDEEDNVPDDPPTQGEYYFFMSTGVRTSFKKGEQVLNAYGRLNNRNLLLDYGFAIPNNRYDTVYFLLWLARSGREGLVKIEDIKAKSEEYCNSTELYGLKPKRLNVDVFIYYREMMPIPVKNFPSDIQVELEIIDKFLSICIELHEDFVTNLEYDEELLKTDCSGRMKSALYYRINQKKIVLSQIKMLETLRKELEKIQDGLDISTHTEGRSFEEIRDLYPLRDYLKSLEGYIKKS
ncbi:hypothetical protein SteCoe_12134 [Stentor coeruleus]|uniref:Rubisco LSMT substrate-binding domain-containing protein n=1 Tax=Stentor coeruleus TaxID=5963 RepID=A0A1R2CBH0_9CILI|nr:hypothetical protein SteCoe_12134 [Stentor coeruleus]